MCEREKRRKTRRERDLQDLFSSFQWNQRKGGGLGSRAKKVVRYVLFSVKRNAEWRIPETAYMGTGIFLLKLDYITVLAMRQLSIVLLPVSNTHLYDHPV